MLRLNNKLHSAFVLAALFAPGLSPALTLSHSLPVAEVPSSPAMVSYLLFESAEAVNPLDIVDFPNGSYQLKREKEQVRINTELEDELKSEDLWVQLEIDGTPIGERVKLESLTLGVTFALGNTLNMDGNTILGLEMPALPGSGTDAANRAYVDNKVATGGDNLGDHTANENIQLGSNWLSGDGDDEGIQVDSEGGVVVDGKNGLVAKGSLNAGSIPAEGAGVRFMWYPNKAALRAGRVGSDQWDLANIGSYSTAMGVDTIASGDYSTAGGYQSTAGGHVAVAMGSKTEASGASSIAMGEQTTASGHSSTAMGYNSTANGASSIAMGDNSTAIGASSIAMGHHTTASGNFSTAMGISSTAIGTNSTVMGEQTTASGEYSTAMGRQTTASGQSSTAMGYSTEASGSESTAMGFGSIASGNRSTVMGYGNTAGGNTSIAMGHESTASGDHSTAMGYGNTASGWGSTAGGFQSTAGGSTAVAMGSKTEASGDYSTAMGSGTVASGRISAAMGSKTSASGNSSTAMGWETVASGDYSTAMGFDSTASGNRSTTMGYTTTAESWVETVLGSYNTDYQPVSTNGWAPSDRLFVIGNGTGPGVDSSDAMVVLKNGNTGIGTDVPTEKLDVDSDAIRIRDSKTPVSATEACEQGEMAWDSNYVYVCVATDSWKRTLLETW